MGDDKSPGLMATREKDRELLISVAGNPAGETNTKASSSSAAAHGHQHHSGREACYKVIRSWASKKFMTGCVILFPIAVTFYITWWFIRFVDGFFSPIYAQLGFNIFGLGFITSITFIFLIGVFMSSMLGASVLGLGEWFIKRMPFVRHIYNASKQISAAISPGQCRKPLDLLRPPLRRRDLRRSPSSPHHFYLTIMRSAYEHMLNPINSPKEWPLSNINPVVPWCNMDKKPGRPSMHARRKEEDEVQGKIYGVNRHGMKYTCSNCGMRGHTKRSCHEAPMSQDTTSSLRLKQPVRRNI